MEEKLETGVPGWLHGQLDDEQIRAVTAQEKAVMVLAGAGSGKTRSFAYRVAWLIREQGVPPWRILALSFTNKAAAEMADRVQIIGAGMGEDFHQVQCSTFHSTGARLLRQYASAIGLSSGFVIFDDTDSKKLINVILKEKELDGAVNANLISDWIGRYKDGLCSIDSMKPPIGITGELAMEILLEYENRLIQSNACDFADLIRHLVIAAAENEEVAQSIGERYHHVLVDEYQDTNASQQALLQVLTGVYGNIWVVGDEDQSIYGWRGADPANMSSFLVEHEGAALYRLQHNYRSLPSILTAADGVISRNVARIGKILIPHREGGDQIQVMESFDGREEARLVVDDLEAVLREEPDVDTGILYRLNSQSRLFEEELARRGIPFRVLGGVGFYERAEVKDLLAYARVVVNPDDEISLRRIINTPRRGIGQVAIDAIVEAGGGGGFASGLQALATGSSRGRQPRSISKIQDFYGLMEQLREGCSRMDASNALRYIFDKVGFRTWLAEKSELERLDNIRELLNAAADAVIREPGLALSSFLEDMALVASVDKVEGSDRANISLLTVHSAKGLEFSNVYLVGFEDGLFPLIRESSDGVDAFGHDLLEEERRLAYVAMTRAKNRLHISHAAYRFRNGITLASTPSRFLHDIPTQVVGRVVVRLEDETGADNSFGTSCFSSCVSSGRFNHGDFRTTTDDDFHMDHSHVEYDEDYEFMAGMDALGPGTVVSHPVWGEGKVISISSTRKLRVEFNLGIKRINLGDVVILQ